MSEDVKIPLPRSLQEIVGSLLFASETPLTAADLRAAVRAVEPEEGENAEVMDVYHTCTNREIDEALKGLEKALEVAGCGFKLVCTGGAYRLQTAPTCGRYVRAMLKLDRPNKLGRASLETLAIIAYRQPLTKTEIEEIRGVDVSGNIKTLMDLQLIRMVGKSELPGHPFLYGTTPIFLEHFGLASLQQLNEIDPTLQRSDPRAKAAMYRKPETGKTELEEAAADAAADAAEADAKAESENAKPAGAKGAAKNASAPAPAELGLPASDENSGSSQGADSGFVVAVDDDEDSEASEGEAEESQCQVRRPTDGASDDDDDIFIDDTPDEFDDDDDDEDDDDEDDEESDDEESETESDDDSDESGEEEGEETDDDEND